MPTRFSKARLSPGLLTFAATLALPAACVAPGDDAPTVSERPAAGPTLESVAAPESGAGGGGEITPAAGAAAGPAAGDGLFSAPQPWTKDVMELPAADESSAIIGWLGSHGGWGTPRLRIEFSIKVLTADAGTPFHAFTPTEDFYEPDCDRVPFPTPAGGALEAEDGYRCTTDGDCHLLVVAPAQRKLYEMWRADMRGNQLHGGCAVVWDLDKSYQKGRGASCTSADAGGFPITPMLFTADEVAKGSIDHAIRFILPNSRIRRGVYVWPATHASSVLKGGADAPPYGVRLRLRRDFPLENLPTEGARVVARALQRYGMILADGGHVPLTAADDAFTEHKWADVGVDPDSVGNIRVQDMEVVDFSEPQRIADECERN